MSHQTPGIKHLFPNTQIMQFQCDNIWRRVDKLDFRFGDELTSPPRRRDDQGDELTCNRLWMPWITGNPISRTDSTDTNWHSNIHKYGVICVCSWLRILFCYITSIILSDFPFTIAFKGFFVSVPYRTDESAIASVSVVSHANYIKPTISVTRRRHYWFHRTDGDTCRDYDMVTLLIFTPHRRCVAFNMAGKSGGKWTRAQSAIHYHWCYAYNISIYWYLIAFIKYYK